MEIKKAVESIGNLKLNPKNENGEPSGSNHLHRLASCILFVVFLVIGLPQYSMAQQGSIISTEDGEEYFPLYIDGKSTPLVISSKDHEGVIRTLNDLKKDIGSVTGTAPEVIKDMIPNEDHLVIAGTIGKSSLINTLIEQKKIDVSTIRGDWESSLIQVVEDPLPNVKQALVIAGSDKRGTIYGLYEISEQIGVSPWHFWADVPPDKQSSLYVKPERRRLGEPAVKYRGIFINDEAPALSGWVHERFGAFNHEFYAHVFELILRLKGNYLWPAMWGRAFYVDDPQNPELADEYGIVVGTTHHEPMMRAHAEWDKFGSGPWNYQKNDSTLREFWRKGIQRMGDNESIVSIGMRGDGDRPMSEEANIDLLEQIVNDQRKIIEEVTGKDPSKTPQVWALYKEVQEYYDKGMRVPEDVTLLFSDDNWGNIRRLPQAADSTRVGGYGIYYHYDYVGGPRSYKWLNTTQISRVWEQMHLAHEYNANRIWIVNVGDIKPMEFPTDFFLEYAWNPDQWPAERIPEFTKNWATQQFGKEYASEVADILTKYTRYNSRRKPELLSADTYSLTNYHEAQRVVDNYNTLAKRAHQIYNQLANRYKAAFYQLVLYPVKACANLNEMYVTLAKNRLYAQQGRAATNAMAESVEKLFNKDAKLAEYYNTEMADGKWNHIMDQSNIGYTSWDDPDQDIMPEVKRIDVPAKAEMGVTIEGSRQWWPNAQQEAVLPAFNPYQKQTHYIEVFNRGSRPFEFTAESDASWLNLSAKNGTVDLQSKINVTVNWKQVPSGNHKVPITLNSSNSKSIQVYAIINNSFKPDPQNYDGFVAANGYLSMEAEQYHQKIEKDSIRWQRIPNLGRTKSALTPMPVTANSREPGGDSPRLEYKIYLPESGEIKVHTHLSPTLNYHDTEGLRYGISIDDGPIQVVNMHEDESHPQWQEWARNNINGKTSVHQISKVGEHTLKFWMVDPGVVLQKIVIDTGGLQPSYLGPPAMKINTRE